MTSREAAIVTAYTGILLGDIGYLYKYLSGKIGREVYTHELTALLEQQREEIKSDFLSLQIEEE